MSDTASFAERTARLERLYSIRPLIRAVNFLKTERRGDFASPKNAES